ncbi:MAG TPA: SDR family NAD(P)-dependent oxidoreductase [Myxococcales bacterium]|nr:SDR family NAD(P)-dependent oxidoreductase [Myxococcales bacterium]
MKILITGATGYIGAHTAKRFSGAGHDLRLLLRPTSKLDLLTGLEYERTEGDITDQGSVERALEGVDALVHMAGNTSFLPQDSERVHQINVDGTRNVMQAALNQGVKKVLYTSSVAAIGHAESADIVPDESHKWTSGSIANHYIASKYQAEQTAWELAAKGLDLVCVNPSIVLGPGDMYGSSTVIFLSFIKGKYPGYIRGGSAYVEVRDVADGHVAVFEKGTFGERYILSVENLTNAEFTGLGAGLAGTKAPPRIPYVLGYLGALFNEQVTSRFDPSRADFNRKTVKVGAACWFVDNSKSVNELGMSYRPIKNSARDTLRWAMKNGHLKASTPELEALLNT